ncbi:hypothetical protein L218DRAFT_1079961 [Marasmius fiardii PR-910]|nr:hypothetical protein L218DRAFT_1079961 [Marasmius fiardii PR-910]
MLPTSEFNQSVFPPQLTTLPAPDNTLDPQFLNMIGGTLGSGGEGLSEDFIMQDAPVAPKTVMIQHKLEPAIVKGTFMAYPHLALTIHAHENGTPCTNPLNCFCVAMGTRDAEFFKILDTFANHFEGPIREKLRDIRLELKDKKAENNHLRDEVSKLKSEVEVLKLRLSATPRPSNQPATVKGKHHEEQMEVDGGDKVKRSSVADTIPAIGYNTVDANLRSDYKRTDVILVQYYLFHPGNPLHLLTFHWDDESGAIKTRDFVNTHVRKKTFPSPINPYGPVSGAQLCPGTPQEIEALRSQIETPGNFGALIQGRVIRLYLTLCQYIHEKAPHIVPELKGVALEAVKLPIHPSWSNHSIFIDFTAYADSRDSKEFFEANPVHIPSVSDVLDPNLPIDEFAQRLFIHHSHASHHGAMISDTGYANKTSLSGLCLYLLLTPTDTTVVGAFRMKFILLLAMIGLYRELLVRSGQVVAATRSISPVTAGDVESIHTLAAHLTRCGISVIEVESLFYFALQYCLDIHRLHYFPPKLRREYARIFIHAQHRSFFYPLPTPPNDVYTVPGHWDMAQIREYRRRQAVIRRWKDLKVSRVNIDPGYTVTVTHYNPQSGPAAAITGVSNLSLNAESDANNILGQGTTGN